MKQRIAARVVCLTLVLLTTVPLFAGCGNHSDQQNVQPTEQQGAQQESAAPISFISGMGCNDPACTDPSHHHDCPEDCTDYDHHHHCGLDCTDASHHHTDSHHEDDHHDSGHHEGD